VYQKWIPPLPMREASKGNPFPMRGKRTKGRE
jgi:hypothetical protein